MNTNWAKILLFSLLSFVLGVILCMLLCGRCNGWCGTKSKCNREMSCMHGGMHGSGHGALGMEGQLGEGPAHGIVKELEAADFQGDTTIAISGGSVNVKREGNRTEVRVMMRDSVSITEP